MSAKTAKEPKTVLLLRTCAADGSAYGGFRYPDNGPVEALDWDPNPKIDCGRGLHGLLFGVGGNEHLSKKPDAKWQVIRALESEVVQSADKTKHRFRRGEVIYSGAMAGAYALVNAELVKLVVAAAKKAKGAHASKRGQHASASGDSGHASASGDSGHASASGYYGHASASGNSGHASASGDSGHASASGDSGHASASGNSGHASASGNYGHASASGYYGHASASGYSGHASASGDSGHASASGDSGHASASGNYGHASASGYYGLAATLGQNGTAKAGANGAVIVAWWDKAAKRPRVTVGYVGEKGIKADTWYRADEQTGALVEVVS